MKLSRNPFTDSISRNSTAFDSSRLWRSSLNRQALEDGKAEHEVELRGVVRKSRDAPCMKRRPHGSRATTGSWPARRRGRCRAARLGSEDEQHRARAIADLRQLGVLSAGSSAGRGRSSRRRIARSAGASSKRSDRSVPIREQGPSRGSGSVANQRETLCPSGSRTCFHAIYRAARGRYGGESGPLTCRRFARAAALAVASAAARASPARSNTITIITASFVEPADEGVRREG
jgi:hypothetical protein